MPEREPSLLAELKQESRLLAGELRESLSLRWQLATLELRAAARQGVRSAAVLTIAILMMLTALPILAVLAADLLDGCLRLSRTGWLLVFGLGLLSGSGVVGWLTWRHFRRHFVGLEQSLEELREDLVWLREWTGQSTE